METTDADNKEARPAKRARLEEGQSSSDADADEAASLVAESEQGSEATTDEDDALLLCGLKKPSDGDTAESSLAKKKPGPKKRATEDEEPHRWGRWNEDEKLVFLYGLKKYGKGAWKQIHRLLPDRSLTQVRTHAQKVMKRMKQGEDIFQNLEEARDRVEGLVKEITGSMKKVDKAKSLTYDSQFGLTQLKQRVAAPKIPTVATATTATTHVPPPMNHGFMPPENSDLVDYLIHLRQGPGVRTNFVTAHHFANLAAARKSDPPGQHASQVR